MCREGRKEIRTKAKGAEEGGKAANVFSVGIATVEKTLILEGKRGSKEVQKTCKCMHIGGGRRENEGRKEGSMQEEKGIEE